MFSTLRILDKKRKAFRMNLDKVKQLFIDNRFNTEIKKIEILNRLHSRNMNDLNFHSNTS